tara:strand:- start:1762 stop:2217 length:456 start_codon:yes stop_codon:yes gene_type:complete
MNSFYRVIDSIKDAVSAEPFNHQVTFGDIADIDLQKQSLFPLCHIMINSATITNNIVQQNMTIFVMDLVDVSNSEDASLFLGNDNRQDILNTQLALGTRIMRVLQKADAYRDEFEIEGDATCEPFTERFENMLAGWAITFTINTNTDMTYC